jgi:hypothetical protein
MRWSYDSATSARAQGVGRRPPAGEPQVLCTFQLDTRSSYRFVSGTPTNGLSPATGLLDAPHRQASMTNRTGAAMVWDEKREYP